MAEQQAGRSLFHLKNFNFFLYGSLAILYPFLPLYFKNAGFNTVQIGLLMSIGPVVSIVANPFWGYWSDRLQNTRLILLIMLIGNLLLSQSFFQMESFFWVLTLMVVFFFFQTALFPINDSLILHSIENTIYRYGAFRLYGSLGFAVLATASSPVIHWLGIDRLGWIYGSFLLFSVGLCFLLPKQGRQVQRFSIRGLTKVLGNRQFLFFLLFGVFISIPNVMNTTFISIYVQELGGSEVIVGWAFFLAAIGEIPVFLALDRYFKKEPKSMLGLLAISAVLYMVRWILMGIATGPVQIVFIQVLHSITFGIYFYTATQLCAYLIPGTYRAAGQSIFALTWMGISGVVAGVLGGWIFDALGSRMMYATCTGMTIIGLAGFIFMRSRIKIQSGQTEQTVSA